MDAIRRYLQRKRERGANAVEFALILPVLLALITGVMDYGWYFTQQHLVINAVREGARAGATTAADDGPENEAEARAREVLEGHGFNTDGNTVTVSVDTAADPVTITVTAALEYPGLIGFVPLPTNLGASLTMRIEDQEGYDTGP